MFVALYEFEIKPGKDEAFRKAWFDTTVGIYRQYGSLGSRLHATAKENTYVAYAQWPSRQAWASDKPGLSDEYEQARVAMRDCLKAVNLIHEMQVTDDFLQLLPFQSGSMTV